MLVQITNKKNFVKWKIKRGTIKDIVKIAYIVAISLVIIQFHISIPVHNASEIEKFDLSMLVTFLCIGIVKLKIILWSVVLVPLIDNLMHGHGILWTPFEILSNVLIVIVAYIFLKKQKGSIFDTVGKIFLVILIVGLRYVFHVVFVSILLTKNLITVLIGTDPIAATIWLLILINVVKFSIIIFLTGIIKIRRSYEERNKNY